MLRQVFLVCVTFGLALRDVTGTPVQCGSGKFLCDRGRCIKDSWRCDGENDCIDGTDEENCGEAETTPPTQDATQDVLEVVDMRSTQEDMRSTQENMRLTTFGRRRPDTSQEGPRVHCGSGKFLCDRRSCYNISRICDGEHDCRDGTDEENCDGTPVQCESGKFLCDYGSCINDSWRCDGDKDCVDGTDEDNCGGNPLPCRSGKFSCDNGHCIDDSWRCDGDYDCADRTDEKNCGEAETTTPTQDTTQDVLTDTTPDTTPATTPATTSATTPATKICINVSKDTHISTLLSSANRTSDKVHALTDGRYYLFHFELNWFQAVELCYQLGLRSATFNTEGDYNQLTELIRERNGYDQEASYWTAGSDLGKRGKWVWHPLGRPLMYTRWGKNEPSDLNSDESVERCIEIKGAKGYTMNDCPCDIEYNVICEKIE